MVLFFVFATPLGLALTLIFTVLLSYLTTLGLTQWFFHWAIRFGFCWLGWKVPLFLFVILVAVGQDYNVYLATRVFEEQSKHGPIQGLSEPWSPPAELSPVVAWSWPRLSCR